MLLVSERTMSPTGLSYLLTAVTHGRSWRYSTSFIPNRDGLGLGTVALIVFGLGLECSGLVNITGRKPAWLSHTADTTDRLIFFQMTTCMNNNNTVSQKLFHTHTRVCRQWNQRISENQLCLLYRSIYPPCTQYASPTPNVEPPPKSNLVKLGTPSIIPNTDDSIIT